MLPSRRQLHALSRDPRFLAKAAVLILLVFGISGWITGKSVQPQAQPARQAESSRLTEETAELAAALKKEPPDRMEVLGILRRHAVSWHEGAGTEAEKILQLLKNAPFAEPERALFSAYLILSGGERIPHPEEVEALASANLPESPAVPLLMAGDLQVHRQKYDEAFALFERAHRMPGGEEAGKRAVELALQREQPEILAQWMDKPGVRAALYNGKDPFLAINAAAESRDYPALLQLITRMSAEALRHGDWVILTLLAGGVWFISLYKACGIPARQWWIGLTGILLGVCSTVLTLFFSAVQSSRGGLNENGEAVNDFVFYVAGVGLREELAKLLLFLPLLPLLRRASPAQALMAASCVGLGFAMEENILYYLRGGGEAAVGRFFTANFMHIALTGLTGLAAFQAMRFPRTAFQSFLAVFLLVVLLHGVYDYMLSVPITLRGLEDDSGLAAFIIVAGLAWFYFQTVRQQTDRHPQVIAPQAVLVTGMAVIIGVTFCIVSSRVGPASAFLILTPALLGDAVLAALFIQQTR